LTPRRRGKRAARATAIDECVPRCEAIAGGDPCILEFFWAPRRWQVRFGKAFRICREVETVIGAAGVSGSIGYPMMGTGMTRPPARSRQSSGTDG